MATPHIESDKKDISKYIIMPGDPKRAKYIAENYLENMTLVNSVRGMTAYTGYYKNKMVTIFPSGMGIPSMGIYSYELMKEYDAEVLIRIGTMGAYDEELNLNDIVIAESAFSNSNYSVELTGEVQKTVYADKDLLNLAINNINKINSKVKVGRIQSSEAFYGKTDFVKMRDENNVLGVEMEAYALYLNAEQNNKKALTILTVSDSFVKKGILTSEEREKKVDNMIVLALETINSL